MKIVDCYLCGSGNSEILFKGNDKSLAAVFDTLPDKDMNCKLDFLTLNEFIDQTLPVLDTVNTIHEYTNLHFETIREIKERFNI